MSDLKQITIDGITLGSNFEVASYRTQRNTAGIAPLRGEGNINASNNFCIDDEVVLNFKVNKNDLTNFVKIYARFKTKGMLLIHSKILAYKLVHGEMENNFSFNRSLANQGIENRDVKKITDSVLATEHFFAMLSDFNIKSIGHSAHGYEIEMVLQVWSDLINSDVISEYEKLLSKQEEGKIFSQIDSKIASLIDAKQNCKLNFTITNEEIITTPDGSEYVKNITTAAQMRIEKEKLKKEEYRKKAKKTIVDLLNTKLKKTLSIRDYQISEFEIRLGSNIATIPIQGKPKPFKQHLGVGECYVTLKLILDENNKEDKTFIKDLKRFSNIKQNDIYSEIEMPIINAFNLKSIMIANIFFTNDDESDAVIVNIIFAANGYSREDLSFYNKETSEYGSTSNIPTFLAFNKWLNLMFHNMELSQYTVDPSANKENALSLGKLSKIYSPMQWQFKMGMQSNNFGKGLITDRSTHSGNVVSVGVVEDLVNVTKVVDTFEIYSYVLIKNNGNVNSKEMKDILDIFKLTKLNAVSEDRNNFSKMLASAFGSMVTEASYQYSELESIGINVFYTVMSDFYINFYERIDMLYKSNKKYINSCNYYKCDDVNIGLAIDDLIDKMLENLGKTSVAATTIGEVKKDDMLGYLLVHLKNETVLQNALERINNKNTNIDDKTKEANIAKGKEAIEIMINNLKEYFDSDSTELLKSIIKGIVKLKVFSYKADATKYSDIKNISFPTCFKSFILSTVLSVPMMIDIFKVGQIYGYVYMQSARLVIPYYNSLYKISQYSVKNKDLKPKKIGLINILQYIFGKEYAYLLDTKVNIKKTYEEKKDYQKYLGIQTSSEINNFKFFFNIIMNTQAHQSKQKYFELFFSNINKVRDRITKKISEVDVKGGIEEEHENITNCFDGDIKKEEIIKSYLEDSNTIYEDMLGSDLEVTGTLYSFNKILGGNKLQNWFSKNEIATKQISMLKYIYNKYENIQKMFSFEYNKIVPDFKITLIQENISNGNVNKRTFTNLNDYVGLDKVINISINFDEETRIKTAIIQIIDTTNILQNMESEINTKSPYRDTLIGQEQEVVYKQDYFSEYPAIKAGQLLKIEMGYLYNSELETEFTGTIVNVNYGKITTITCNNFMADLMAGDISVNRYDGGGDGINFGQGLIQELNKHQFFSFPSRVNDMIGDSKDVNALVKMNLNPAFIDDANSKPYFDQCEKASNYNILAEALRKQQSSLVHLNNTDFSGCIQFGSLSNEIKSKQDMGTKIVQAFQSYASSNGRIYENLNNVDQDKEMYSSVLLLNPQEQEAKEFEKYKIKEMKELQTTIIKNTVKTSDIWSNKNTSTVPEYIYDLFTKKKDKSGNFVLSETDIKIPILFKTGSPFCVNNFKSLMYKVDEKGFINSGGNDNLNYTEGSEAFNYISYYNEKHTNVFKILKIIEKRLPGVFFNVLEYGDYGTLFLGKENYNIKNSDIFENEADTDDFNLAITFDNLKLEAHVNKSLFEEQICLSTISKLEHIASTYNVALTSKFDAKSQENILKEKQKYSIKNKEIEMYKKAHHIVSGKNLISNEITVNENFSNSIFVDYEMGISDVFREVVNFRWGGVTLKLYSGLSKEKTRLKKIDHEELKINTRDQALSVAQSALKKEVENIYGGTITALYIPGIKYRDEVIIQDFENKIFGTVVVKDFKHIFDKNGAFTIITPMLKTEINSLSNEVLLDSFWSQFVFLNPEYKANKQAVTTDVDKTIKNLIANDAYHKPIYFAGYGYEYKKNTVGETDSFVDKEITMNTHLPLKIYPLIQKDVFLFPDMEDYGKIQPTKIAKLINFFSVKTSQFGYFFSEYNKFKQISLFGSQAFYKLTSGLRNFYDYDTEALKYASPSNVFLNDKIAEDIMNTTAAGQFNGTGGTPINGHSRVIKVYTENINDYGILFFNTKDTVVYKTKNDKAKTLKGNLIPPQKTFEKIEILGDMACQFEIASFVEIYASNLAEAIFFAEKVCERANFSAGDKKKFAVSSASLLCGNDYSKVKNAKGEWVQSLASGTSKKSNYERVIQNVISRNKYDVLSRGVLLMVQGKTATNSIDADVDETVSDLKEYGITIHNIKTLDRVKVKDGFLNKMKNNGIEFNGILDMKSAFNNSLNFGCHTVRCYGFSDDTVKVGTKRVQRDAMITTFKFKNPKSTPFKDDDFSIVNFHNYYGSSNDIMSVLNLRKKCVDSLFDKLKKLSEDDDFCIKPIVNGDFNLNITTFPLNNSPTSELYFIGEKGFLQYGKSETTIAGKSYDKFFLLEKFKNYTTDGTKYQSYLNPATNTQTNFQSDVSDHFPIFLYIGRKDI